MKMYDYYSMEMQSKFICVLPTSLQQLLSRADWEKRTCSTHRAAAAPVYKLSFQINFGYCELLWTSCHLLIFYFVIFLFFLNKSPSTLVVKENALTLCHVHVIIASSYHQNLNFWT